MVKEKKIYCSHCGTTEGVLSIYSRNKYGHVYYNCRGCNTNRLKAYRKTEAGKIATRKAVAKSTKKYWKKQKARIKLNYHVRVKNILKPKSCSQCNKRVKIEAHHEDYSKPLDVIWTCRPCHTILDRKLEKC